MIRSELLNVRATPTARLLLLASMVMAAISLVANLATFDTYQLSATATIQQAMHASTVATLTFALVAGLVTTTSDYRFGRIDQLLLREPRHAVVLAAKTVVGFVAGVIYGLAGSVIAVASISAYYRAKDVPIDLTSATVVQPIVGVVIASGLFAAIGIGLGTLIRNQPAAIGTGLVLLLVVQPPLLLGVPNIGRWLPGAAGLSMTLAPGSELLGQVGGSAVLAGWTVVILASGYRRLQTAGA